MDPQPPPIHCLLALTRWLPLLAVLCCVVWYGATVFVRSGYFTSRPALKRYTRVSSQLLNVARHWSVFSGSAPGSSVERLWEALSVVQHHDAVAGTARQAVTDDYALRLSRGGQEADAAMQRSIGRVVGGGNSSRAELLPFQSCPLSNYSICPPSQQSAQLVTLLYNPLARQRREMHSVPVQHDSGLTVYSSTGQVLPSQLVRVPATQAVWQGQSAPYLLHWLADVPALGFDTYFVLSQQHNQHDTSDELAALQPRAKRHRSMMELYSVDEQTAAVSIENACWRLSFDSSSGQLQSAYDKQVNVSYPFTLSFLYYKSRVGRDGSSSPYSFAPDGDAVDLSPSSVLTAVVSGPLLQSVSVNVSSWLSYTVRLANATGDGVLCRSVEVEYVLGPLPVDDGVGKEVVVRYRLATLNNSGVFYTDSNGREMQRRVRNSRPSFNITLTEPVSSNYYPVVSTLRVTDAGTGVSLYVLNDRSNGGSSLNDGEVELMLHRRLVNKALAGEALDEQQFGRGLVIRGTHSLLLADDSQAATDARGCCRTGCTRRCRPAMRRSASRSTSTSARTSTSASYCQQALPPHVELISLYWQPDGSSIVRLAHSFRRDRDQLALRSARHRRPVHTVHAAHRPAHGGHAHGQQSEERHGATEEAVAAAPCSSGRGST